MLPTPCWLGALLSTRQISRFFPGGGLWGWVKCCGLRLGTFPTTPIALSVQSSAPHPVPSPRCARQLPCAAGSCLCDWARGRRGGFRGDSGLQCWGGQCYRQLWAGVRRPIPAAQGKDPVGSRSAEGVLSHGAVALILGQSWGQSKGMWLWGCLRFQWVSFLLSEN